jgi:hypothetical protein
MPIRICTILALTGRLEKLTAEEERQAEKMQETINQLSDRMEELQATKQDQATISFSRFFCSVSRFSDAISYSIGVYLFLLFKIVTRERGGWMESGVSGYCFFLSKSVEVPSCTIVSANTTKEELAIDNNFLLKKANFLFIRKK